jgi:flavin reductase (DIM6/NTAB) family NADH-FMN oxidoreductase RutF
MAAAAVRYLRLTAAVGGELAAEELPEEPADGLAEGAGPAARPQLRSVGPDERTADTRELRSVLGRFCTGVTVISAVDEAGAPVGFACQSFSSLSLDPPLVSFNVARTSASWPRIARAGGFCVSVLAADQGELCRALAVSSATGADKFAGLEWAPAPVSGAPRIAGALAWVDCSIHAVHTGGDHLIVLGRVNELAVAREDCGPLLFYRGGFGELG